jgi:hypothetical protein
MNAPIGRLAAALVLPLVLAGCPGPSGPAAPPAAAQPTKEVAVASSASGAQDAVAPVPTAAPGGHEEHGSPGFTVLGTTAAGRSLFLALPASRTLESAIGATADELAKVLDAKPALSGAFGDARSKSRGGALLTGKLGGHDVRGMIFCGVAATGVTGARASVVLATTDASPADMATLFGFLPGAVATTRHVFPDGSGSVDLPEGWTTAQTSATFGVFLKGPAGQSIGIGNSILVNTPDGRMVKMREQSYAMSMQTYKMQMQRYRQALVMHQRYPNTLMPQEPKEPVAPDPERDMPGLIFCRICSGPEEVLQYLYPVGERRAKRAGGPYTSLDRVIEVVPADPNPLIAGARAGVAYLAMTDHDGDKATPMRVINRIETYPVLDGKDTWVVTYNNMRAPDTTFDRELPVMNDILASFKLNGEVVQRQIEQAGAAVRKMGEDNERLLLQRGREFNERQAANFQRFESQMAAQSKARHDSTSDFIEYISGVRNVYDTATGKMHGVDLFNANAIVDCMNASGNDPGRFVQIPLRAER